MGTDSAYQYNNPQDNRGKKKVIIVALLVVVLGVTAAVTMLILSPSDSSQNSSEGTGDDTTKAIEVCETEECFNEKFISCQPAQYVISEGDKVTEYKIPNTQEINCPVSVKYIKGSNQELIGKDMTCNFDNSLDFRSALNLAITFPADYECEGDLASQPKT